MSSFQHRNIVPEMIDDFNMSGDSLDLNLEEIEWINKNLGGTQASVQPLFNFLQQHNRDSFRIVDVGCGSGDLLRYIEDSVQGIINVDLLGLDANPHILNFAKTKLQSSSEIDFQLADVFSGQEEIPRADVYLLNLFLHHFETDKILELLYKLDKNKPRLIIINDLDRSRFAYFLFRILCYIKSASDVTIHDGGLSIKKGFKKRELVSIGRHMKEYSFHLRWQWAFRWQLVLTRY